MKNRHRETERALWQEVMKRLDFFVRAFEEGDIMTSRMAGQKLSEALLEHDKMYVKRLLEELDLEES